MKNCGCNMACMSGPSTSSYSPKSLATAFITIQRNEIGQHVHTEYENSSKKKKRIKRIKLGNFLL